MANKEEERFKAVFSNELLEYHFEKILGENKYNHFPWRVLLEDKIQPHTDILCNFSQWLIERGWSRDIVRENFFIVIDEETKKTGEKIVQRGWRRFFALFRTDTD